MFDQKALLTIVCLLVVVELLYQVAWSSSSYPAVQKRLQSNLFLDLDDWMRGPQKKKSEIKSSRNDETTRDKEPHLDLLPCPSNPILTSYMPGGRLGNRIFQYASMWALSVLTNQTAFVSNNLKKYLTRTIFTNLSLRTMDEIEHCDFSNNVTLTPEMIRKNPFRDFISSGVIQNQTTEIKGYLYQPYLLPLVKDSLLRNEFVLKEELRQQVEKTIDEVGGRGRVTVGVHVRRTDYICHWKGTFADAMFYKSSMQWFRENIAEPLIFLIVSDEPEWCRKNLVDNGDVVIANKSPEHDLALLAMSNHTIIDYGSFSFWGALLSSIRGGHTIMYQAFHDNSNLKMMQRERKNWHNAVLVET